MNRQKNANLIKIDVVVKNNLKKKKHLKNPQTVINQ